ncbi:hypothetical protein BVG19_g721 [[Candida] boidinii]|nr:hypothetical protein BVG19_g721 [[Candida] boidinii]OWB49271.1 hypothetical protein B5S27_g811 [[Candida] boidinii]
MSKESESIPQTTATSNTEPHGPFGDDTDIKVKIGNKIMDINDRRLRKPHHVIPHRFGGASPGITADNNNQTSGGLLSVGGHRPTSTSSTPNHSSQNNSTLTDNNNVSGSQEVTETENSSNKSE